LLRVPRFIMAHLPGLFRLWNE